MRTATDEDEGHPAAGEGRPDAVVMRLAGMLACAMLDRTRPWQHCPMARPAAVCTC